MLFVSVFYSCTKELELDESTQLLLEKQEKLNKLDQLFDLSFENAMEAEEKYRDFVQDGLLTETLNYLDDADVSWRNSRTNLAIRMNANFQRVLANLPNSLFDMYKAKFETNVLNRTLLGQSPQQLKNDERFENFEAKVTEIDTFFDERISELKAKQNTNETLLNKNWKLQNKIVGGTTENPHSVFVVNFDFTLLEDNQIDISRFFFFPFIPKPNVSFYTQQDEEKYSILAFISSDLLTPAEYVMYNNKICFYLHLKSSIAPFEDNGKPERKWVFEYEYKINDGQLVLSNPRMVLNMYPHLLGAEPGDDIYETLYNERLKEFTLTAN